MTGSPAQRVPSWALGTHGAFFRHTLLFGLLFTGVWAGLNRVVEQANPDPTAAKYALLYAGATPPGSQLWGTSHVVHGVSPCALGPDVQNMAFHAATPSFYRAWYAEWRRLNPPPRRVYFGLDLFVYKRFPWARQFEQDSGFWPWSRLLARLTQLDDGARVALLNRAALIRQRDALQGTLVSARGTPFHLRWGGACRGFVPLAPRARAGGAGAPPASFASGYRDDPAFEADLPALLDSLHADQVTVVAFQPPYLHGAVGEDTRTNVRLNALLTARRIPFLNYNAAREAEFHGHAELFVDNTHLAEAGALRFSRRLAHDLAARGLR